MSRHFKEKKIRREIKIFLQTLQPTNPKYEKISCGP